MLLSQLAIGFNFPDTVEGWIFEIIGMVASVLVFVSFFWSNEKLTRIVNMTGCVVFVVYGFLIGSLSVCAINGACFILHIVKLVQMYKRNKQNKPTENNAENTDGVSADNVTEDKPTEQSAQSGDGGKRP